MAFTIKFGQISIAHMPNIASILKIEISRVARKEVRGEVAPLRKSAGISRTDIAALKRRVQALELELRRSQRAIPRAAPSISAEEKAAPTARFSAKGLASQRQRLGLSAEDCGLLVGASGQSIYNWESGKTRPRTKHLAAIADLKGMGKRQAKAKLTYPRDA